MKNEILKTFLIGYIEEEIFLKSINESTEESIEINEEDFQYFKCQAPNIDAVSEIISRRFSDVHIVNISLEEDYENALQTLSSAPNDSLAYILNKTDDKGMGINEVALQITPENEDFVIAEMQVGELKKIFLKTKSIFTDPKTPVLHWKE